MTYLIVIFSAFLRYLINIPKQILDVESYKVMTGAESKHTRPEWGDAEIKKFYDPATLANSRTRILAVTKQRCNTDAFRGVRAHVTGWQLARPGALIVTQPARRDQRRDATPDHPNISTFAHFNQM